MSRDAKRWLALYQGAIQEYCRARKIGEKARLLFHDLVDEADWQSGTVECFSLTGWADDHGYGPSGRRTLNRRLRELIDASVVAYTPATRGWRDGRVVIVDYDELVSRSREKRASWSREERAPARDQTRARPRDQTRACARDQTRARPRDLTPSDLGKQGPHTGTPDTPGPDRTGGVVNQAEAVRAVEAVGGPVDEVLSVLLALHSPTDRARLERDVDGVAALRAAIETRVVTWGWPPARVVELVQQRELPVDGYGRISAFWISRLDRYVCGPPTLPSADRGATTRERAIASALAWSSADLTTAELLSSVHAEYGHSPDAVVAAMAACGVVNGELFVAAEQLGITGLFDHATEPAS